MDTHTSRRTAAQRLFQHWLGGRRHPAECHQHNGQTFTFEKPLHYWPVNEGQWYFALNLIEELDAPGEWWFDRTTQTLFVFPPKEVPPSVAMGALDIALEDEDEHKREDVDAPVIPLDLHTVSPPVLTLSLSSPPPWWT